MASEFTQGADLTNPLSVAKACEEFAKGMDQQSVAAQSGTALAGHPAPAFFYGEVARVLRAAAGFIQVSPLAPTPTPEPVPPPPSPPPTPAVAPKADTEMKPAAPVAESKDKPKKQ